jgi:hypothetical protein
MSAWLPKPDLGSRKTRWIAKAYNETVQFSLGEFQGQIDACFRGHVTHKPDRQFEYISVRQ